MIPPSDHTCPKCGNQIPYGSTVCSVCGQGGRASRTAVAIWAVLLVLVGLPAGLLGGCFILIASGGMGGSGSGLAGTVALGGLGVLLPVFFLVMLIRAGRR